MECNNGLHMKLIQRNANGLVDNLLKREFLLAPWCISTYTDLHQKISCYNNLGDMQSDEVISIDINNILTEGPRVGAKSTTTR